MSIVSSRRSRLKNALLRPYKALIRFINRFPLITFFLILGILLLLVVASNQLTKTPPPAPEAEVQPKKVAVFHVGDLPRLRFTGRADKSGTITLTAQAGGVVSAIPITEGKTATTGQRLISLASSYQGGNAASLQRQIAATTYTQAIQNVPIQQAALAQRRTIAEQTAVSAEQLRTISRESLDETREIIASSKNSLRSVDDLIATQEEQPSAAINDLTLASLRQQRIGLLNGITAAEQSLRSTAYSSSEAQAPAALARLAKETTLKQLDLEARSLTLNVEISRLNLRLAQVAESAMFPSAPFASTVEKIHVKVGQAVAPGTPLVTLSGLTQTTTVEVSVPADVAARLSHTDPSVLSWDTTRLEITPQWISTQPTIGTLSSIVFTVPSDDADTLTQDQTITVDIPIDTAPTAPFIPLDAIYQTETNSYIYVVKDGKAVTQSITVGKVFDGSVEVLSGIDGPVDIILDRSIVAGTSVVAS